MGAYDLILADPPWEYREPDAVRKFPGTRTAVVDNQYDTMTVAAMVETFRPLIDDWAAADCALAMWSTWPKLPEMMDLGKGWGFDFVTGLLVWVKMAPGFVPGQIRLATPDLDAEVGCGLGFYSRSGSEFVTLWRRGKPPLPEDRTIRQVLHAPRREHSRKPDESYRRIEALWPNARRLEMFARQRRPGWDAFGNECDKFGTAAS